MKSKVHPTYKTKYRVANWPAYNQALVRRGDVTVWLSSEAIAAWTPRRSGQRGGQRRYSDLAIETALTLRLLYHLPLRQAEGFLHALFGMMRLDLSAPDYTTLSRRSQHLQRRLRPVPPGEGIHLVLDSTGLSIVGEGEWAAAKHGGRGRRGWRKLHLGVDWSPASSSSCSWMRLSRSKMARLLCPIRSMATPSWLLRSSAPDAACLRRPSVVVVEPAQHREGHDAPAGLYAARPLPLVRDPLPDPLVRSPPVEVSHPFGEHAA